MHGAGEFIVVFFLEQPGSGQGKKWETQSKALKYLRIYWFLGIKANLDRPKQDLSQSKIYVLHDIVVLHFVDEWFIL